MICSGRRIRELEMLFRRIERERMRGLPILNSALRVKAIGFREWRGGCLGVLITPWFMNLMLLPHAGDEWSSLSEGDKQLHRFPSGSYEFILGEAAAIGRYQMCSLFSPVFEFTDQATAEATAEAVMQALMEQQHRDGGATLPGREQPASATLEDRLARPMSRRELLRGRLSRGPHEH